jgi:thioredoxin-like negative regulator of GroEL
MIKAQKNTASPAVLMLMGTQCAYCGSMMQMLTELMKSGSISELRIVNIEKDQELAAKLGVRSVPWLQIGAFELQGAHSRQELMMWIERASSFDGVNEYLAQVLTEGKIDYATRFIARNPQALQNVLQLMADPEAKINVRLGVGVIIEDMAESRQFEAVIPQLIDYLSNKDARIRSDACHYLSLTKNTAYIPLIEKLLSDESEDVREIAQDSLDELTAVKAVNQ